MRTPSEGGSRQVEVDFGPLPAVQATFIIADAGVIPGMHITGNIAWEAPPGKALDELEMDTLSLRFGADAGSVTINVNSLSGPVSGKFLVNYNVE